MTKALIAMSGGVDSSVAAYLTRAQGYDCIGCTMKLYDNPDAGIPREHTCCSLDDIEDARSVAYRLGMPYYVFGFMDGFREKVMERFADGYLAGQTPNPCIDCNRYMKFDKLLDRAKILSCEYIVTGHYARIEHDGRRYLLKTALDETKDQSYVLYFMTQELLAHTLFPLGTLRKTEVRKIAAENGFVNSHKPDSQDICFVPDGDYPAFIERYTGRQSRPGSFVDADGEVLGEHRGIIHYTIGQRKKLGLSFPQPKYVCRICPESNTVVLGDESGLFSSEVEVADFNWISGEVPPSPFRCRAKIRYRQAPAEAVVTPTGKDTVRILFDEAQRAVTPGQAAVLYDGCTVLGGGTILPRRA